MRLIKGDFIKLKNVIRLYNFATIILIIVLLQLSLTTFQYLRYIEDVYDCSDMSQDCEKFFTSIGIKTRYVHGWYYDNSTDCGKSFHVWLELDFGLFKLPFESTYLVFISPTINRDYNEITVTDNYVDSLSDVWGDDIYTR